MSDVITIGPKGNIFILGIKLVGANAENGSKFLFSLAFVALTLLVGIALKKLARLLTARGVAIRTVFWTRQGINLFIAVLILLGIASIWFDDPTRLTTALGLVTAGLAFALQKVVTSLAGYFVILRGNTFNVGDRIVMGGVRGDVISLSFTQTTIMEMGQTPAEQSAEPAMWVKSRQYTGRIVTVPNAKIFDEPVYNFTRDFDYIWEELTVPIPFSADRRRAEQVLIDAATKYQIALDSLTEAELTELKRRYYAIDIKQFAPKVYLNITDNWIELAVRFVVKSHGVREVKDLMNRQILDGFERAGIRVASATFEIVGMPSINVTQIAREGARA